MSLHVRSSVWAHLMELTIDQALQQGVEAKKNERANALKEVKRLCKEFH